MNNTSAAAESFTLNRIKVFWLIRRIGVIRTGYSDFIIPAAVFPHSGREPDLGKGWGYGFSFAGRGISGDVM